MGKHAPLAAASRKDVEEDSVERISRGGYGSSVARVLWEWACEVLCSSIRHQREICWVRFSHKY
jgi:hypothetical protein